MNISEDASPTARRVETTFVTARFIVGSFKPLPNFALTARGTYNLDDRARRRATPGKTRGERKQSGIQALP